MQADTLWSCKTGVNCPAQGNWTQEFFSLTEGQNYQIKITGIPNNFWNSPFCNSVNIFLGLSDDLSGPPPHNEYNNTISACDYNGPLAPTEIDVSFVAQMTQNNYFFVYQLNDSITSQLTFEVDASTATPTDTPTALPRYTPSPTYTPFPTPTPIVIYTYIYTTPAPASHNPTPTTIPTPFYRLAASPTPTPGGEVLGANTTSTPEPQPTSSTIPTPSPSGFNFFDWASNHILATWGIIILVVGILEYLIFRRKKTIKPLKP